MKTNGSDILIYLSVKYRGNWDKIYDAINQREEVDQEEVQKMYRNLHYKAITLFDNEYPEHLKNIFKPPFVLYYDGDISLIKEYNKCLAVVGSREPSQYGRDNLVKIVDDLSKDCIIVSGCALGVDAIAQEQCLKNCGKTVGVLGSGIDVDYPKTNTFLIGQIRRRGLLISEYPEGVEASPENFPIRNRIIVGLSKSVMAFDVRARSGTQCTASLACQADRNLLSIPYPLGTDFINNTLIKDGCYLVENGDDVRFLMNNF